MNTNKISNAALRQTPESAAESTGAGVADETARREFERLYHLGRQEAPKDRPGLTPERPGFSELPARADKYGDAPPEEKRNKASPPLDAKEDESLSSLMRSLFAERLGAPPGNAAPEMRAAEMVDTRDAGAEEWGSDRRSRGHMDYYAASPRFDDSSDTR
jgi:hypothetical protein